MQTRAFGAIALLFVAALAGNTHAFQVDGKSSTASGVRHEAVHKLHFTRPVHEGLTHAALHVAETIRPRCGGVGITLPDELRRHVVRGSVWNDDPMRYMPENSHDWYVSYIDGDSLPPVGSNYDHLYQSHFGPLQFLHSMGAPHEKVAADIHMWAELVFRIGRGEFKPETPFSAVRRALTDKSKERFDERFYRPRSGWDLNELFLKRCNSIWSGGWFGRRKALNCSNATSAGRERNEMLKGVALGSLLHIVQDSYSASHAERGSSQPSDKPSKIYGAGPLMHFKNYKEQSLNCHAVADGRPEDERQISCLERAETGCRLPATQLAEIAAKVEHNRDNPIGIGAELVACVLQTETPEGTTAATLDSFLQHIKTLVPAAPSVKAASTEQCPKGRKMH